MGVVKKEQSQIQDPLQPKDFFSQFDTVPNTFGNVTTKETVRQLPSFNPKEYSYLNNPTPYDDVNVLTGLNASKQPYMKQAENALQQFGANFVSGFGQGLANLLDVSGWGNDNYQSSLFGISTKDMQDWAEGVAKRNKILRENPGQFEPGSFGWWMEQTASAGTGLGMGAFALAETVAIEFATGGLGTGAAISRLGNLIKNIKNVRGTTAALETINVARDLRSAATVFGIMNRTNESRMEAMMSYQDIYDTMSQEKNPDGTAKYTKEEVERYAAAGADRTFMGNMALLPLDILAYRTMVFNPVSGTGTGLIEKAIGGIGNKYLRKGTQFLVGAGLEGTEEGFQYVASEEGKHYAKVLGGQDDGSSFLSRVGQDVQQDEFWNNFAGGVIGSPIIGGMMNLTNRVIFGNRTAKLNSIHNDYIQNIGKMDNAIANKIRQYEAAGETQKANILRRQFGANKALSALHLDAMTDKNTAFDSYLTFLQGTLDEVNNGKFDALNDLGFENPTQEQVDYIKTNFQNNIDDAMEMKSIYDNVKGKYNKNFVPEIAQDYYQLNRLLEAEKDVNQRIVGQQAKLSQFGQLSSYGREQYNAEYQLRSLMVEQERLTDEYRETENPQEKENVNQLLEANKSKITSIKERLKEIGKTEEYTSEQRSLDNDILQSALRDKDYSQAMYDKEHLENAIALQRKNIALWNNKTYLAEKTKQSISRAKTRQQVDNTEEAVNQSGENTPEIQQAIEDKKNAIAAQAAAQVVDYEQENKTDLESIQGNANLFEEDNALIDGIKNQQQGKSTVVDDENQNTQGQEEFLLAPSEYDFDNSSPEAKARVVNGVRGLVERVQGEPDFEKLVRHVAKVQGIEVADNIFNALKWGWEANGYNPTDYNAVYDKVFGNPMEDLMAGTQGLQIRTPGQLNKAVTQVTNQVVAQQQQPQGFDNNNQPVYKYEGVVTNEASPKMAFTTRLSQIIQQTDDEGNIIVSHEYTEDELNQGDYVDSLQLLDPDKFDEGTEMVAAVPVNYLDIKIPVYNADGTKGQSMTFGQYVASRNLSPDSQEYKDKLPIIIYKKGSREKGVAFVHDIGWYHPLRFHQEFKDSMDKAIAHTREIRDAVINSENNSADITITGKRQTTFAGLKTKPNETITLREANPQTQLTIALTTDSLSTSKNNRIFPNNETILMNVTPFSIGQVLDVRRYGTKDGKKTYMAFPVTNPKLDAISRASVLQAINIYGNRSNQVAAVRQQHDPVVKAIQATMGLDILSPQGLEKYLQHFITTFNTEKASTNQDAERQAQAKLKPGTPYIAFIAGGNIVIGKAGQPAYVDKAGNKKYSLFINPNSPSPSKLALDYLGKEDMIGWYNQNVSLDNLNRNKPVVTIDRSLNTNTASTSYNDFLLDRLRTDIKSYNIGTAEKPNYVTNIQPVITYELNTKIQQGLPTNTEVKAEVLAEQPTVLGKEVGSVGRDVEAKKADIERRIQEVENFVNQDFFANTDVLKKHWQSRKDLFENKLKQLKSLLAKGLKTGNDLKLLTDILNDLRAVTKEGIELTKDGKISDLDSVIDNLYFDLADSLFLLISDNIIKEYITLKNESLRGRSTTLEKALLQYKYEDRFAYTTDGKNVEYFLSKETLENAKNNKKINAKYDAELKALEQSLPTQEVKAEQTTSAIEISGNVGEAELTDVEKAIIEQAKRDLGSDFGISKDNSELFSPAELSKEQREAIAGSINRIAGLTPDQQFDIVDFMYNQVTAMVNLDTKQVTKADVDKQVNQAFKDVIEPLKTQYENTIKDLEGKLQAHPALQKTSIPDVVNDYKYRLGKIAAIEASMDILKEEAYNRVAKYTGITENKVQTEQKNDDQPTEEAQDIAVEDEANDKERDFWTDILQENPESRLSYSMRRFFGQVRKYDKTGKPVNGFLGLPTYTGSDTITRTLMVTLADVPSDFDTMIKRLEERKAGIPWMQEVIDRLKGATAQQKQQFVTVMSNTSLRMKFTMISFNRKTNSWTTKVWDTHLNGVADSVKREWSSNFKDSSLVIADEEGNYKLNDKKAANLVARFEGWTGKTLLEVPFDLSAYRPIVDKVRPGKPVSFTPAPNILQWLKTNVVKKTDRVKFSMKGSDFQITKGEGDSFVIDYLKDVVANKEEVADWLKEFGITLSPETLTELTEKGLFHNYQQRKPNELFDGNANTNGLFGILANQLKYLLTKPDVNFTEEGNSPLDNSVINSLANLEAKYNTTNTPFGFRDNGKSFFALTAPKFITDRVRDLKTVDSEVRKQLQSISFSQPSLWLTLLEDNRFKDKFNVSHIGANAFKELGKKLYKDNAITKLADVDHELTKLGMFWDTTQGEVRYGTNNLSTYPGTSVEMRMATMFSPTMSDKHMMTLLTTAVLNLGNAELNNGAGINADVTKIIYEQTVKPELQRMIKFYQNGGATNISAYDKGAGLFLFLPGLNNMEYAPGLKLIDAIKHQPTHFTLSFIEGKNELMETINENIKRYVDALASEKLEVWKKNGLVEVDEKGDINNVNYFDKKYKDKFRGNPSEIARMAAMDFVINYMVANANSFMTLAGDPALYYKSKSSDPIVQAKDTFVNVGKRLANQIAPGTTLSNSENEKYLQVFIDDRKSLPEIPFLKFVTKINDGKEITDAEIEVLQSNDKSAKQAIADKYPVSSGYFAIEGSDAQEYTTWKEHLDILAKLGKTPDTLIDITPEDIAEARDLFASGVSRAKLTEKQLQLIGKVMQPIKPVYTGQLYDAKQDVMRTVYIKSSSFPLIPQLTAGMEIDKLREAMEKLENSTKMNVRASYQTANKVGSLNNPMVLWNSDGTTNEDNLKNIASSSLILDRKNFRIQQEVPFKSGKVGEDKITLGTQLMKLLFGDEIMNYDGFTYNGKSYSGKDLHREYNQLFIKLVQEKRSQLYSELGLDDNGVPVNIDKSMDKLQALLKDEAVKRGYPLQDIEGLTFYHTRDAKGKIINTEFNLPLWASTNSNRYESMLNSIISNRLIRMKFPGNSFVVGSEEGFIKQDNLEGVNKSRIIWTSAWNGKSLQAAYHENGKLKKAQVLIASKFKTPEGELIDLFTKENGEYKYVTQTETGFNLKHDMFDGDLLSMVSFRIPTSGHQSASQIEIAGFLPAENADLMIVPRNFTKQKGLDFDVDKENSYQLWTYMTDEGKFEVLQEKHRASILAKADKALQDKSSASIEKLFQSIFGDMSSADIEDYTSEELSSNEKLAKLNSKINEKLMQNEIIKINHSILGSNNPEIQAKINKTLNTDYAEAQAEFIDQLANIDKDETFWTPLSDEYQKQKMMMGASGKIGTGAYSLDVVFHSLTQQAAINGKPIQLIEIVGEGDEAVSRAKTWRFGKIESDGQLGRSMTLDGSRSISEVMAERQNVAVDNEKLQIMGRVNLNDITMDVDKVMNMLGFDKGKDGNSISFLFLSQPIIKEFVEELKNANSNLADFEADKEGTAFEKLIAKYEGDAQVEINDDYWKVMSDMMTNENFITAIRADKPDGKFQAAVLRRFMDMRKYGIAIRGIQTTINTDSKGLGKSFFDVIEKRNALNRLGSDSNMIVGASGLIGDYISKDDISSQQLQDVLEAGYVDIGDFVVKPDTLSGGFNIYGVSTAYNMWNRYFPYDAPITTKAFNEVLSIISSENAGDTQTIERKQEIFRGMKKYFAASKINGIISQEDDINAERARLFIDTDTNTSLAKYLKTIRSMTGNAAVDQFIKTNKLINRFEFDIQKNGQPSLIKYNNASGEEFDEQYLYESLATLMEIRGKTGSVQLPEVGNKKYTLDTLAQDLIAYCYLGNAIQEAIQFTKYVPVSYLNQVGFSTKMRQVGGWLHDNPNVLRMKIGTKPNESHLVSEFTMQFIQHNPERVRAKYNEKDLNKLITKKADGTFIFKDGRKPTFVSVYDTSVPKGEKKFRLYWFDGEKYSRIPVLGMFGMDEYQPRNQVGTSIVNGKQKSKATPTATTLDESTDDTQTSLFNIETGDSYKIMKAIADTQTTVYAPLAKHLLDFSDGVKVVVADTVTMKNGNPTDMFYGHYEPNTRTITINRKIIESQKLADTFVHEMVHHLTYHAINPHISTDAQTGFVQVSGNAPVYAQNLVRLFNYLKANVDNDKIKAVMSKVGKESLTGEEKQQIYGFTNIHEFMAMSLTNSEFQKALAQIEYKNTGQSILQRIKQIINEVLSAMGVKFESDTAAAAAINSIFEVIEKTNFKVNENPYQSMYDETMNEDTSFLNRLDDELNQGDPEGQFEPEDSTEKEIMLDLATAAIITDISDEFMQNAMLQDVEGTLREAAAQLNASKTEAATAREFYGNDLSDIALKMFPNETVQSKYLRDYINNLPSDQIEC